MILVLGWTTEVLAASAGVLVLAWLLLRMSMKNGQRRLPPGPPNLPLLGSTPFMVGNPRLVFNKLWKKYGDIYTVYVGRRRVVVLNSVEFIKECFVKRGYQFDARPDLFWTTDLMNNKGLVSTFGPMWKEQRGFTMRILREFGMGKAITEERIVEEIQHLLRKLQSCQGQDWNPTQTLNIAVANIISAFLFARRFEYTHSPLADVVERIARFSTYIGHTGILNVFPWLRNLPGDPMKYWKMVAIARQSNEEFYIPMIEEHKSTFDPENLRDFVDAYLGEICKTRDKERSTFTDTQLLSICKELLGAGTETTAWTLHWALAVLLNRPDIQTNIQEELDSIDRDQVLYYSDRKHCPYTDAFIHELQRFADLIPFGMAHATSCDVLVRGYYLPKGTMVLANLSSVHTDSDLWPDPHKFDPSRFLGEDGERLKREQILPFSTGCRMCPGDTMARMELFMFITAMLQNFTFVPPSSGKVPNLHGIFDIVHHVEPFDMQCVPRHRTARTRNSRCDTRNA